MIREKIKEKNALEEFDSKKLMTKITTLRGMNDIGPQTRNGLMLKMS